jgi:hypothetical protein
MSTQTCQFREKLIEKMLNLDKCMQNKDNMIKNYPLLRIYQSFLPRSEAAPASNMFPMRTFLNKKRV